MAKEVKIDTIRRLNDYYGFEHLNPMIAVGHYKGEPEPGATTYEFGVYAIYIKETKGCNLNYGLTKYDFDEMSVTAFAPGQKVTSVVEEGQEQPRWTVLAFHPDFLARTSLGGKMSTYGYFSYNSNEALHLSKEEVDLLNAVLSLIEREMKHSIDRHSRSIIISHIEVFLDYCLRFYERQFITRKLSNNDILSKFDSFLHGYFADNLQLKNGLPTVNICAEHLCMSTNYFSDLIKKMTGEGPGRHIRQFVIRQIKNELASGLTVAEVAYKLGFEYPAHLSRMFKKETGQTPTEYIRSRKK